MGRQKRREPILIENIEIIDTASKGKSVAKHDGRAIFVQGGVPGDICDIVVFKRRKKDKFVIKSFQQHYLPNNVSGKIDKKTFKISQFLVNSSK